MDQTGEGGKGQMKGQRLTEFALVMQTPPTSTSREYSKRGI